ncbi:predicted protein [Postia placenta Mad-698-R]|uniref:DUF6534 domain-containing protein n=1 Tax=Postia placenta MAD-698-R-SB12 TaxID=670580 RepID=A0A1X6N7R0_9APHY|nr:hypothetical protein POSPLADRAFT_1133893 [Postia placenta MAD-698-R-SB12]EED79543.1 predicted protein [Postia placenta Mad-698-R]OSX64665.1 hypothetical protein POSPLADRAFT_1133893 [Postia placenta MAD-698-R-SB12]
MSNADCKSNATHFHRAVRFYGFSCAQTMFYFYTYRKDKLRLKILVVDFEGTYGIFSYSIMRLSKGWKRIQRPNDRDCPTASYPDDCLSRNSLIKYGRFYVHSIWIFPLRARHPAVKSALTFTILPGTMQPASAFLTDLYIATSLSVILKQQKTGLKGTDYLLSKLALYAIHRGIFTAVFELLELLTVMNGLEFASTLHQTKLLWALFHFPGSQVGNLRDGLTAQLYIVPVQLFPNFMSDVRIAGLKS